MILKRHLILLLIPVTCFAADEPVISLTPLTVYPEGGAAMSGNALDGFVPVPPVVCLNSQGGFGRQTDISIQGSSFSGAGLTVAGIALRNPQTEHFHAELPFPDFIFLEPAAATGLEQALNGQGFLAGSVALSLREIIPAARLHLGAGDLNINRQAIGIQDALSAGVGWGLFAERMEAGGRDYDDNDLSSEGGGGQIQLRSEMWQVDLLAAHRRKEFGARGFYGVSPALFAEEKTKDTLVLATARRAEDESWIRASASWQSFEDDYRLFWTLPGIYENRHRSDLAAALLDGRADGQGSLALNWRASAENEELTSESLGDHSRSRGALQLIPEWEISALRIHAGVRAEAFSGEGPAWLPQAGISIEPVENMTAYLAYTETVRQPSFTELNYESPGSLGNEGLDRQQAGSWEGGVVRQWPEGGYVRAVLFERSSSHTVDWVKPDSPTNRWTATDLGRVKTRGLETEMSCPLTGSLTLHGFYSLLDTESDFEAYSGRYVLDYPEHRLRGGLAWDVLKTVQMNFVQEYRRQTENPERTTGRDGYASEINVTWSPGRLEGLSLSLAADNVWDDDFQTLAGQKAAGRQVYFAMEMIW